MNDLSLTVKDNWAQTLNKKPVLECSQSSIMNCQSQMGRDDFRNLSVWWKIEDLVVTPVLTVLGVAWEFASLYC
jgi:hypothetical protein